MRKTFLLLLLFFIANIIALSYVNEAKAEMRLTEGEFIVLGTDPSPEDFINQLMFRSAVLEIDGQNKVKGLADTNFTDYDIKGALFSGQATLEMTGEYDVKENRINGNFSVKHTVSMVDEQESPLLSYYNDDVMTFNGTFSGDWSSAENGNLVVAFTGTKRSVGKRTNSNGLEDEYDNTNKWSNKAEFGEDWCLSLMAKTDNAKHWKLIAMAQAKDSGARFTDFSGEVLVIPAKNPNDESPAERDMVLEEGDIINTGGDSCAIISFGDMSTFIMKPRSSVILGKSPEKQTKLRLVAGNIWVNLKHIYETGQLDVTMNQAIAGTKGTTFVAGENGSVSSLQVLDGLMSFKSLVTGEEIDVAPGEKATADTQGVITKTNFDIASEAKIWDRVNPDSDKTSDKVEASSDNVLESASEPNKNKFAPLAGAFVAVLAIIGIIIFTKKRV